MAQVYLARVAREYVPALRKGHVEKNEKQEVDNVSALGELRYEQGNHNEACDRDVRNEPPQALHVGENR